MNRNSLQQLEEQYGKYGSWALWNNKGQIVGTNTKKFKKLFKPNVIFLGLNANIPLRGFWHNYHSETLKYKYPSKNKKWENEPVYKLACVLEKPELKQWKGAYMSDIIKSRSFSSSQKTRKTINKNRGEFIANVEKFKKEQKILAGFSNSEEFVVICIGNDSYNMIDKAIDENFLSRKKNLLYKIPHFSNWGKEPIKKKIYKKLRKIIKDAF